MNEAVNTEKNSSENEKEKHAATGDAKEATISTRNRRVEGDSQISAFDERPSPAITVLPTGERDCATVPSAVGRTLQVAGGSSGGLAGG